MLLIKKYQMKIIFFNYIFLNIFSIIYKLNKIIFEIVYLGEDSHLEIQPFINNVNLLGKNRH